MPPPFSNFAGCGKCQNTCFIMETKERKVTLTDYKGL